MLDPRPLEPRVEVLHVDEDRTPVVRNGGDGTRQLLVAELAGHEHDLARLEVGAVNRKLREAGDAFAHRQAILLVMPNVWA